MIRLVLTPEIKTCVEGDNTEGLTGEVREYLYVKVANQLSLFEDGVVSTQNGDGRRSPWPHQQVQSASKSTVECR